MSRSSLLWMVILLVAPQLCLGQMGGQAKPRSAGVYVDSKATAHRWEINDAHALNWAGSAYVPVGGMFCFAYLTSGQSEENWKKDTAGIELLKKNGIKDLYINPVNRATNIPATAFQRVIDYLDENGFRYGIQLTEGLPGPFEAYLVKPEPAETLSRVKIDVLTTGFGNYWDEYPACSKRLVEHFSKVRFGPGLRFFVDPFLNEMGMRGEAGLAIPDSPQFRKELASYLKETYPQEADLAHAWIPGESLSGGYEQAARLVPMQQGAGDATDPETARRIPCTAQVWRDISRFRDQAIVQYMNRIADLLKSKVANVPVIYKWTHPHPIFTNSNPGAGFDGLGMEIYTVGEELGRIGVHAFAQVEDAARGQWLIVTETQDTSSAAKPKLGYPSEEQMHSDLDWMRKAGAKGFFVFGFQLLPQPMWNNFELLRDPKQLLWLADYREKLRQKLDFASTRPMVLHFPAGAGTSARPCVFKSGFCWMPTSRTGRSLGLPEGLDGYYFDDESDTSVLWAQTAAQEVTFTVPKGANVHARSLDGKPAGRFDEKGEHLSLTLSKEPLLLGGLPSSQVFPSDRARAGIEKFQAMIAKAQARGMNVQSDKEALNEARKIDCESNARGAYDAVRNPMTFLEQKLTPLWIEGEACTDHNFPTSQQTRAAVAVTTCGS